MAIRIIEHFIQSFSAGECMIEKSYTFRSSNDLYPELKR